jgi:hypothetical protein
MPVTAPLSLCDTTPRPRAEQRKWPRYPVRGLRASVIRDSDKAFWTAEPQNLSRSGIKLRLDERIDTGTQTSVIVYRDNQRVLFQVPMEIVYVLAQPGNRWIAGGAFDRELSDQEVKGLC